MVLNKEVNIIPEFSRKRLQSDSPKNVSQGGKEGQPEGAKRHKLRGRQIGTPIEL